MVSTQRGCSDQVRNCERDAFAAAEGDPACGVAERLTRKGWPLAANPWRALRKCNVRTGHAHTSPAKTADFLWILDFGFRRQIAHASLCLVVKFERLFKRLSERPFRSCSRRRVDLRWSSDGFGFRRCAAIGEQIPPFLQIATFSSEMTTLTRAAVDAQKSE